MASHSQKLDLLLNRLENEYGMVHPTTDANHVLSYNYNEDEIDESDLELWEMAKDVKLHNAGYRIVATMLRQLQDNLRAVKTSVFATNQTSTTTSCSSLECDTTTADQQRGLKNNIARHHSTFGPNNGATTSNVNKPMMMMSQSQSQSAKTTEGIKRTSFEQFEIKAKHKSPLTLANPCPAKNPPKPGSNINGNFKPRGNVPNASRIMEDASQPHKNPPPNNTATNQTNQQGRSQTVGAPLISSPPSQTKNKMFRITNIDAVQPQKSANSEKQEVSRPNDRDEKIISKLEYLSRRQINSIPSGQTTTTRSTDVDPTSDATPDKCKKDNGIHMIRNLLEHSKNVVMTLFDIEESELSTENENQIENSRVETTTATNTEASQTVNKQPAAKRQESKIPVKQQSSSKPPPPSSNNIRNNPTIDTRRDSKIPSYVHSNRGMAESKELEKLLRPLLREASKILSPKQSKTSGTKMSPEQEVPEIQTIFGMPCIPGASKVPRNVYPL